MTAESLNHRIRNHPHSSTPLFDWADIYGKMPQNDDHYSRPIQSTWGDCSPGDELRAMPATQSALQSNCSGEEEKLSGGWVLGKTCAWMGWPSSQAFFIRPCTCSAWSESNGPCFYGRSFRRVALSRIIWIWIFKSAWISFCKWWINPF